jgi:hypothetical protein
MTPFAITTIDQREEMLRGRPHTELGFLCPECFVPVLKTILDGGAIYCGCDCYTRLFDDLEKVERITSQIWADYIQKSVGQKFLQQPIVNPSRSPNYNCRCPGCRRDRNAAVIGAWISPDGELVCTYGVCKACIEHMEGLSEEARNKEGDRISEQLSEWFPFLEEQL